MTIMFPVVELLSLKQKTKSCLSFSGITSDYLSILAGVPQGFIIGHLLQTYINDTFLNYLFSGYLIQKAGSTN